MSFNPGDKVLVYSAPYDRRPTINEVERVTKTQVILSDGGRYRHDGCEIPYHAGAGRISAATEDQIAAIEQARIRQMRSAIGEYVSKAGPGEIEWLYGALRERGMLS